MCRPVLNIHRWM